MHRYSLLRAANAATLTAKIRASTTSGRTGIRKHPLYASGDNAPAGSTQVDLDGHSDNAGGTGTFNDPVTLAVGGSIINGKEVDDCTAAG
ncbi:hypothetical protein ABIA96_007028 [Bradyrhizobium sp. LB11.1]